MRLNECYSIGICTLTCPKGLDPRKAISHLKDLYAEHKKLKDQGLKFQRKWSTKEQIEFLKSFLTNSQNTSKEIEFLKHHIDKLESKKKASMTVNP